MCRNSLFLKVSALVTAVAILFASCSSSTLIQSEPVWCKVYMNGEYKVQPRLYIPIPKL